MGTRRADGASGATGYKGPMGPVAGFCFWERESEEKGKEVKKSEANICKVHGRPLHFGDDVGYGCSGIRCDYGRSRQG